MQCETRTKKSNICNIKYVINNNATSVYVAYGMKFNVSLPVEEMRQIASYTWDG